MEQVNIDFHRGLTVLSGETGAGKSVLIEAICLALGKRADSSLVRQGAEKAEITAIFEMPSDSQLYSLLEGRGLTDESCILRRVIYREGQSRAFCNDSPVTTGFLQSLSGLLADVHAQQQSQLLLEPHFQRQILDMYANAIDIRDKVNERYEKWKSYNDRLENLAETKEKNSKLELIDYQLNELEKADFRPDEVETIEEVHKQLASADNNLHLFHKIKELLANEQNGASFSIETASNFAEKINTLGKSNLSITLSEIDELIKEAIKEIDRAYNTLQTDPEQLREIERRLSQLHELARKHNCGIKNLGHVVRKLRDEKSRIESQKEDALLLEKNIQSVRKEFDEKALVLTQKRTKVAKAMAKEVSERLTQLGIPDAKFEIKLETRTETTPTRNGTDIVSFQLATNPKQKPSSLAKVASGGELSRTGLAIRAAVSSQFSIPTLIYDEIDTGIGGTTATIVGQSLLKVSENCQVICITHSPQVASAGDHHYLINKKLKADTAIVTVDYLNRQAKEAEIARMLGTPTPQGSGLEHARELIRSAARVSQEST